MKGFLSDNRGSITLEATIVFPVFVVLVVLLVNFIKLTSVYLAMDHAVSETVKQVAVHSYPLKYLNSGSFDLDLPSEGIVQKKLEELYPLGNIKDLGLRITTIKIYDSDNNVDKIPGVVSLNKEDIVLRVEYDVNLQAPFFPLGEITLSNTAVERAWVDG